MLWEAFSPDRFPQPRKEILMKEMTANVVTGRPHLTRYLILGIILAVMILIGFLAVRGAQKSEGMVNPSGMTTLSQSVLEEKYGLRVNLVAVTAAGGLVDLRLKIVDGEKAKSLLQGSSHFPALWIADGDVTLVVPEETRSQAIQFENDSNLFVMFPNVRGMVKPGTPVIIRFGDTQVEPIPAK
jgi:hypothetical protein